MTPKAPRPPPRAAELTEILIEWELIQWQKNARYIPRMIIA